MWLRLMLSNTRDTYIAVVYRPPDGTVMNALSLIANKFIDVYPDDIVDVMIFGGYEYRPVKT